MTPGIRKVLASPVTRRVGTVLSLALVAWIAWILYGERDRLGDIELDGAFYRAAGICILVVMAGNLFGSLAMRTLLVRHNSGITVSASIIVTGMAQLAKYLPGNIVHLVGRFLYVQQATSAGIALWFSLFEVILLATSAAAIGVCYLHFLDADTWSLASVVAIFCVVVVAAAMVLPRTGLLRCSVADVVTVLALYLASYLGYGLAFALLMQDVVEQPYPGLLLSSAVFALAFLGGYVTPGAPGGLGVREFLMMTLATPLMDAAAVLAAVVLFRFLSIAGDLIFGFLALLMQHFTKRRTVS